MAGWFTLLYGLVAYATFTVTFLYAIGFVGNVVVPKGIDSGAPGPLAASLAVNALLLAVFAVQHSVMARPAFKRAWTRIVPKPMERSTYVLAASLALCLLFWQWRPIVTPVVWDLEDPRAILAVYTVFGLGFSLVLVSSFLINHFDLFGLRQVWLHLTGRPYTHLPFRTPGPYRLVRHPLYVGWLVAFWAAPTMTVAHLVFAIGCTGYILAAIPFEESDLEQVHGEQYRRYRRSVGMFLPRRKRDRAAQPSAQALS